MHVEKKSFRQSSDRFEHVCMWGNYFCLFIFKQYFLFSRPQYTRRRKRKMCKWWIFLLVLNINLLTNSFCTYFLQSCTINLILLLIDEHTLHVPFSRSTIFLPLCVWRVREWLVDEYENFHFHQLSSWP